MAKNKKEEKKNLKEWFVKNIILPNNEIIDKPGFIMQQFNEKDTSAFLREMLFPEKLLADIELKAAKKYGTRGREALYKANAGDTAMQKAQCFRCAANHLTKIFCPFLMFFAR